MRKLAFFLASIAVASSAAAATPTAESIQTLLTVTKAERTLDTMMANMDRLMQQSMNTALGGAPRSAEQQRILDTMRAKTAAIFREEMTWAKMEPVYVSVYQETFTQEEIDGLIAFYRTPTGVAYVDKLPIVLQKSLAATSAMMGPMMRRVQAVSQQAIDEAKTAQPAPKAP
jgi:uncharacterized protein